MILVSIIIYYINVWHIYFFYECVCYYDLFSSSFIRDVPCVGTYVFAGSCLDSQTLQYIYIADVTTTNSVRIWILWVFPYFFSLHNRRSCSLVFWYISNDLERWKMFSYILFGENNEKKTTTKGSLPPHLRPTWSMSRIYNIYTTYII